MWHDVSSKDEAARLLYAIKECTERRGKVSFFLSAVESGNPTMTRTVFDGIKAHVRDPKVTVPRGKKGSPVQFSWRGVFLVILATIFLVLGWSW